MPRGEPVPFAFLADAERYRSNVAPPPPPRRSRAQKAGGVLFGLTVVAGLVGSLLLGGPALDAGRQTPHGSSAAEGR